jgi:hypothetical protein
VNLVVSDTRLRPKAVRRPTISSKKYEMKSMPEPYVASFQTEPFHKGRRHHWMICLAENTEELVSWGYEATRELAEAAAQKEVQDLSSGMTQGGHVTSGMNGPTRRSPALFLRGGARSRSGH